MSVSQDGQSVDLAVYRYAFDRSHRLLAVTADYWRRVAVDPAMAGGLNPAHFVVHVIVDRRHRAIYLGWPAFLTPVFQSRLPATARHRERIQVNLETMRNAPGVPKGVAQRLVEALARAPSSPLVAFGALSSSPSSVAGGVLMPAVPITQFSTTANISRAGALGQIVLNLARAAGRKWTALVWVHTRSLIREVQFTSPPIATADNASFVLTCDTRALGTPVRITDPASSDVVPITALPH